jgi:hypothetical protein
VKIKLPNLKKNNREDEAFDGVVFDLTGETAGKVNASSGAEKLKPESAAFGLMESGEDAFEVSVRNSDPILKRLGEEKAGMLLLQDLPVNLATAAAVVTAFSLILTSAYVPEMVGFVFPALIVVMLLSSLEALGKGRIRLYTAAAIAAALIVVLIIFRKYIGNGWALIMNQFYDTAEMSQAYLYHRFHIGETGDAHPYRSMHFALLWGSALAGLVAALPLYKVRRTAGTAILMFLMIALAYYGVIPSWICIAIMAVTAVFILAKGHILSSLPVLLVVMLVFGAIMLVNPGENIGISRADENFRDRFALMSSFLQRNEEEVDIDTIEEDMQDEQQTESDGEGSELTADHRWVITLLVIAAVIAAIGFVLWRIRQRILRRQLANRAGIDSEDPATAITAMFPYAVRWLQPAGIDASGKAFDSLIPVIKADLSEQYADDYTDMYELWKEAAYSDHAMTEESRQEMKEFLNDTITMIKEKGNIRTNFVNAIRYAL